MKVLTGLALVLLFCGISFADSFESFIGWDTLGDTRIVDSSFGVAPTEGFYQAYLNNMVGIITANYRETAAFAGVSHSDLDNFSFGLYGLMGNAYSASAVRQSFIANTSSRMLFDWEYLTNDGPMYDYAFVVLDGTIHILANYVNTHFNSSIQPSEWFVPDHISEYRRMSWPSWFEFDLNAGLHTVTIGIMNTTDNIATSGLLLDNFRIEPLSQSPAEIVNPEPSTIILLLSGLIVIAVGRQFIKLA